MSLLANFGRRSLSSLALVAGLASASASVATATPNPAAPLYSSLPPAIQKAGKIQVVADLMPPYRITAADGKTLTGLEAELIDALEKQLGVDMETTIVANGPAVFTGIDTGRYDLSFGPALATAEREKRYDMIPWLISTPAFVIPTQHGFKTQKLLDLCGARISVMSGSAAIREIEALDKLCAQANLKTVQQVVMPDQNATLMAAQSGRSDAFSMQFAAALHLLKTRPGEYTVQTDETGTLTTLRLGMILKSGAALSPVMVQAMQSLVDGGEYLAILDRWGLAPAAISAIQLNPNSQPR